MTAAAPSTPRQYACSDCKDEGWLFDISTRTVGECFCVEDARRENVGPPPKPRVSDGELDAIGRVFGDPTGGGR